MKTVTYERSGRTNTGAQAVRVEGMKHLRVLEQGETVVERIFREVRPFRIYDGPSEVHRWSIARSLARGTAR